VSQSVGHCRTAPAQPCWRASRGRDIVHRPWCRGVSWRGERGTVGGVGGMRRTGRAERERGVSPWEGESTPTSGRIAATRSVSTAAPPRPWRHGSAGSSESCGCGRCHDRAPCRCDVATMSCRPPEERCGPDEGCLHGNPPRWGCWHGTPEEGWVHDRGTLPS